MFGDVIMVLEFLYVFGEFFSIKQDFPDGITLGKNFKKFINLPKLASTWISMDNQEKKEIFSFCKHTNVNVSRTFVRPKTAYCINSHVIILKLCVCRHLGRSSNRTQC